MRAGSHELNVEEHGVVLKTRMEWNFDVAVAGDGSADIAKARKEIEKKLIRSANCMLSEIMVYLKATQKAVKEAK